MREQLPGRGSGRIELSLGALARLEEHRRYSVLGDDSCERESIDQSGSACEWMIRRMLEAERAESDVRVVYAVTVKMHDLEGLVLAPRLRERRLERVYRRRLLNDEVDAHLKAAERLNEGTRCYSVIDEGRLTIFGPG